MDSAGSKHLDYLCKRRACECRNPRLLYNEVKLREEKILKNRKNAISLSRFASAAFAALFLFCSCSVSEGQEAQTTDNTGRETYTEGNQMSDEASVSYIASTVKELKKIVPKENSAVVMLEGYYSVNDGGGGMFWWDSSDESESNEGTVIAPEGFDQKVGRYKRIYEPQHINVKWVRRQRRRIKRRYPCYSGCN